MSNISFGFIEEYTNNLPKNIKEERRIINKVLSINGCYIKYLNKETKENSEYIKKAIQNNPKAIKSIPLKSRIRLLFNL